MLAIINTIFLTQCLPWLATVMAFKSRIRTQLAIPTKLDGVYLLVADPPPDNSTTDIDTHPNLILDQLNKIRMIHHHASYNPPLYMTITFKSIK